MGWGTEDAVGAEGWEEEDESRSSWEPENGVGAATLGSFGVEVVAALG